jgi:hypothetical protein
MARTLGKEAIWPANPGIGVSQDIKKPSPVLHVNV